MWLDGINLTTEEEDFCRYWLSAQTVLQSGVLTRKKFTEYRLSRMLRFELSNRRRPDVLDRLHARLSKLRRAREMAEIVKERERLNEREAKHAGESH